MAKILAGRTNVFDRTLAAQEMTVVNRGGARSSKSYSIAQLLIHKALKGKHVILVTRKTLPALKMTALALIIGLLKEWGYYNESCFYQSSPCYYRLGKSIFWFVSTDEIEKLKSTEFTEIWMEEANQFTWKEYLVLKMRLSGKPEKGERNHIYLSFNPMDANHWIPTKLCRLPDVLEIQSTYKDNPTLDQDYVNTLLALKEEDPNYYLIYALGEYGSVEGLIYPNFDFKILDGTPDDVYYGLDFGFTLPTALVEIAEKEQELYLRELVYQSRLLTSSPEPGQETLLSLMAEEGIRRGALITADSEDPRIIEEIYQAGYNIHPASKGPGSVSYGIGRVKRRKIHIHPESVNLIKEFQGYKWKVDKNGNTLDEPVKFSDHGIDATRYAITGVEGAIKPSEDDDEIIIEA